MIGKDEEEAADMHKDPLEDTNRADDDDGDDLEGGGLVPENEYRRNNDSGPSIPWLANLLVTMTLDVPWLSVAIWGLYHVMGRPWVSLSFALHWTVALLLSPMETQKDDHQYSSIRLDETTSNNSAPNRSCCCCGSCFSPLGRIIMLCVLDMILFGLVYPMVITEGLMQFFYDSIDDTVVLDWKYHYMVVQILHMFSYVIVLSRFVILMSSVVTILMSSSFPLFYKSRIAPEGMQEDVDLQQNDSSIIPQGSWDTKRGFYSILYWIRAGFWVAAIAVTGLCTFSLLVGLGLLLPQQQQQQQQPLSDVVCDPLDTTECSLPFPSFFHMTLDDQTETGYRVNLASNVLPLLKGRIPIDPSFLNDLDGFSTMGPYLFYMEGLKEAHEQHPPQSSQQLQGRANMNLSTTKQSITFLVDMTSSVLVQHSAEIDYLDPKHPLVMIFPGQPLYHAHHYAIVVLNATDANGNLLPPTLGMKDLLQEQPKGGEAFDKTKKHKQRSQRYQNELIPALEQIIPWFSYQQDPQSLQLLFDFVTVSEQSQLGPIRVVRDSTLEHVQQTGWDWTNHVRTIKEVDYYQTHHCQLVNTTTTSSNETLVFSSYLAKTIHAELDVPWFLNDYGRRTAILEDRIHTKTMTTTVKPRRIGTAKFILHIPCSVRSVFVTNDVTASGRNTRDDDDPTISPTNTTTTAATIRSVVEYGHGLFFNRKESECAFLNKMAHENRYLIVAMDWRGMSLYDLPMVIKTLLATPSLFQSIRDNIIQGYGNKFALQHFIKHGLFMQTDWFHFEMLDHYHPQDDTTHHPSTTGVVSSSSSSTTLTSSRLDNSLQHTTTTFYGISQGGILGAGYMALSGKVPGLMDRAVLGVPGTSFSLIMSRSLDFIAYDHIMLFNFYTNRHVRIFLSLAQMCWDSVEGAGLYAPPVTETFPPLLLQAGLGDPIVPAITAETLGRALNASIISPFQSSSSSSSSSSIGTNTSHTIVTPHVVLTEILYVEDYKSLPVDDRLELINSTGNEVHFCVRRDPVMMAQVVEFLNTGNVINPCVDGHCIEQKAMCTWNLHYSDK